MNDQSDLTDPLIEKLKWFIRLSVRILAILMTFVILWGVVDVGWVLYQQLILLDPRRADEIDRHNPVRLIRALEIIESGAASTQYMKIGDTIRIEMAGSNGQSIFGAIDQRVVLAAT